MQSILTRCKTAISLIALIVLLFLTAGCMATFNETYVPAVLTQANEDTKAKLQIAASQLFFGHSIKLSNDAFEASSTVVIERHAGTDTNGRLLEGRKRDSTAIELSLWLQGSQCYLRRADTQAQVLINSLKCQALEIK